MELLDYLCLVSPVRNSEKRIVSGFLTLALDWKNVVTHFEERTTSGDWHR
jgi:hypothetical protein